MYTQLQAARSLISSIPDFCANPETALAGDVHFRQPYLTISQPRRKWTGYCSWTQGEMSVLVVHPQPTVSASLILVLPVRLLSLWVSFLIAYGISRLAIVGAKLLSNIFSPSTPHVLLQQKRKAEAPVENQLNTVQKCLEGLVTGDAWIIEGRS
jgi:ABC-type glycerol-3-phosphate transport system permease component